MTNRNVNFDAKLMQAQRLRATNDPEQALDVLCDCFAKSKIKAWEPTLDKMAQLALELSSELSRPVANVIKRYAQYSISNTYFPATIEKYIDDCYSHIEAEVNRTKKEEQNCNSPLLKLVDLPRLLHNSIVRPAVEFMNSVFLAVLTELKDKDKARKYDQLYHEIIQKAFNFSAEFNNSEYLKNFSTELYSYTNSSVKKGNVTLFIDSQYVRYETAVKINNLEIAIYALDDATKYLIKDKSISPSLVQKIRKAKYDLLKKNGYKLYSAIIHSNLLELYKENKTLTPEMPLDQLHEVVLIEALTSPLVQKSTYIAKTKLEIFLDVTGEAIPSRESLIKHLFEQPVTPALSDFVNAAEFGTDPFVICEKFRKFQEAFNQHEYYKDFKEDLENYAALRVVERTCVHYTKIYLDELTEMITWLESEKIEDIIVQASRDSIIPGHINQQGNYVELIPRGEQCLQPRLSNLNDKLRDIYDHFQRIKKVLPANLASRVISSSEQSSSTSNLMKEASIYDDSNKIEERKKLIKERRNQAKRDKELREKEIERRESERRRQKEEQELKNREEEMKRKAERDKNEQEYNFALTEIMILAKRNDINVDDFLNEHQEGEPEHSDTGTKSENLNWIKFKAEQIKIKHIENKRSQSSIIAEKMNEIKLERGRERVRRRLAFKIFIENSDSYKKEPELIQKFMERQAKNRKKQYEAEMNTYETLKKQCENAKSSFQSLVYQVNQKYEDERLKNHPNAPTIGLSFQINTQKQPDMQPSKTVQENPLNEEKKAEGKETETKQSTQSNKYVPPQSGKLNTNTRVQPPAATTSSPGKYMPQTSLPQQNQPSPQQSQQSQKPSNSQTYRPPTADQPKHTAYKHPTTGFNLGALSGHSNNRDRNYGDRDRNYGDRDRGYGGRGGGRRGGRGGQRGGNRGHIDLASKYGSVDKK